MGIDNICTNWESWADWQEWGSRNDKAVMYADCDTPTDIIRHVIFLEYDTPRFLVTFSRHKSKRFRFDHNAWRSNFHDCMTFFFDYPMKGFFNACFRMELYNYWKGKGDIVVKFFFDRFNLCCEEHRSYLEIPYNYDEEMNQYKDKVWIDTPHPIIIGCPNAGKVYEHMRRMNLYGVLSEYERYKFKCTQIKDSIISTDDGDIMVTEYLYDKSKTDHNGAVYIEPEMEFTVSSVYTLKKLVETNVFPHNELIKIDFSGLPNGDESVQRYGGTWVSNIENGETKF